MTERWSGALTAPRLLIPAGLAAVLILVYFATHGRTKYALVGVGLPVLVILLSRNKGAGFLVAVAVLLVIPYWKAHVWLIAPVVVVVGLLAGRARTRFHPIDLVFALVVVVFSTSWLFHPELNIPFKQFIQGILPFAYYVGARLTVDGRNLRRVQVVMLGAGAFAACTVLLEVIHGSAVFVDPNTDQWAGSVTKVFRAGGIFGGSPTAATVLATVLLGTVAFYGKHPTIVRVLRLLILGGIIVTLDRAGYLGLLAGSVMLAILLPYRRWLRVAGVAVILLAVTLFFVNSPTLSRSITHSRLVTKGLARTNTISARENLLADAVPLIADSPSHLLVGRGFDAFEAVDGPHDLALAIRTDIWNSEHGPNNDYVRTILEQGLIGLIAVLLWFGGALLSGIRACLRLRPGTPLRISIAGLSAATFCYAVAAIGHDFAHNVAALSTVALVTGLLVSAASMSRREAASDLGHVSPGDR